MNQIDTEYLEYVADMLKQIRNQLAALNLGLAEMNLGIGALIGEKQVKNGDRNGCELQQEWNRKKAGL